MGLGPSLLPARRHQIPDPRPRAGAGELRLAFPSHHPRSRRLPSLLAVGSACLPLAPVHPIPESSRPRGLLPWGKLPRSQGLGRMPPTLHSPVKQG